MWHDDVLLVKRLPVEISSTALTHKLSGKVTTEKLDSNACIQSLPLGKVGFVED